MAKVGAKAKQTVWAGQESGHIKLAQQKRAEQAETGERVRPAWQPWMDDRTQLPKRPPQRLR